MHHLALYSLAALAALVLYKVIQSLTIRRQHALIKKQLGCQDPPVDPHGGFLGINTIRVLTKADREGRLPDFIVNRNRTLSAMFGRTTSTVSHNLLGQKIFFTCEPKNIQALLATQFSDYDLGETRNSLMGLTLGSGIFTQDGKQWEHSRAMLRPNFIRDQVSDLDMEERHVQNLLSKLPAGGDGWTTATNIQVLFFRLTIDAATDFLFGESLLSQLTEAQQSPAERQASFATNFDSAQSHMAQAFRLGDLHWLYRSANYTRNRKLVNDFVQRYVDLALQQREAAKSSPIDEKQQPERYVFLNALAQQTQDPIELRSQILNILVAGRDTTASLLSWTMLELLRHPEVFTKLRLTILEAFGPYTSNPSTTISFASLKSCQYLQYVLSEALRMWAVVPGNVRRSNKDTTLPLGGGPDGLAPVFIPAHTTIEYSVHVMHHRKDLWGEDADEFRPERFVGRKFGWEYLPFNGGPRICIGQQFALTEASYVLVRLLQRFDQIEVVQGPEVPKDPRSFLTLTMSPKDQVTLRLHQAPEGQ